jgi:MerR family redox-sensitive transcriptional activator SoxR
MTIGELSKCTGLPSSTLRYWERVKILPGAVRIHGQRRYATDAVNLIAVVTLAQRCGFSLEEIRRLIHGFKPGTSASERWRTAIHQQRAVLKRKIKEFNAMLRLLDQGEQCQCMSLSDCGRVALKLSDSMPRQPGLSGRRAGYGE